MNKQEQERFLAHVGEYFRQQRIDRKYTQDDIAHIVGKSIRWVQKFEKGEIDITLSLFIQVSHLLEVPREIVDDYFQQFAYAEYDQLSKEMHTRKKK